jgi:hypothetical protein
VAGLTLGTGHEPGPPGPGPAGARSRYGLAYRLGGALAAVARFLLLEVCLCLGIAGVMVPVLAVPSSVGAVKWLLGLAGVAAGAVAGVWLYAAAKAGVRWPVRRLSAGAAAWAPLFRRPWPRDYDKFLVTLVMLAAVPALIGWGPVIGTITLVNGLDNQQLQSELRQHGVPARGYFDVVTHDLGIVQTETGNPSEAFTVRDDLEFRTRRGQEVLAPIPGLAGWDGDMTSGLVPVVYDPAQPTTAALAVQLRGSQWAAPVPGTLVSAALLTAGLPALVWALIRRFKSGRAGWRDPPG